MDQEKQSHQPGKDLQKPALLHHNRQLVIVTGILLTSARRYTLRVVEVR